VPLYRQFLTDDEYKDYLKDKANFERPSIRMMGQGQGQRSASELGRDFVSKRQRRSQKGGINRQDDAQGKLVDHIFNRRA
jgi:hypothetical protein